MIKKKYLKFKNISVRSYVSKVANLTKPCCHWLLQPAQFPANDLQFCFFLRGNANRKSVRKTKIDKYPVKLNHYLMVEGFICVAQTQRKNEKKNS